MSIRRKIIEYSRGSNLEHFWRLYRWQKQISSGFLHDVLTFLMSRCAYRHGGYIGPDAVIKGRPVLPHGLQGIFISRYASVGEGCRIYQNVTIGEVNRKAPVVGNRRSLSHRCGGGAHRGYPYRRPGEDRSRRRGPYRRPG